ncbi:unc-51 like kinase 3 homolog Aduk isoform X3 [Lasioglossum baleicum]|uniref:unc-51 like kinase 3 homolog Aduk isoform X3 n=1 Tax=Lasioglossum baleicum TaxID=434251 RepID=UPI003FCE2E68
MSLPSVSDYSLLEKLGSGSYATVYKAIKKDGCREVVAIKCVDKSSLSKSAIDNLVTEINLLKILNHEHIVEMRDFFWDDGHIYIVMEYCDAGDLSSFIKKRHKLPEKICRGFLQQLALALRYLRNHDVSHMDLKPQNLLLTRKPQLVLKVGDFGLAQYLSNSEQKFAVRGSPLYMAPEILLKRKYDARVDLWSVGVIMYECLFGKAPYSSGSVQELAEKIKDTRPIELPKGCHVSRGCKDLLLSLLKHDPDQRITFDDFFAHDYLDLAHAPTKENYEKAVELIQQAVKMDTEKNSKEAFYLYCEALRYFIPVLTRTLSKSTTKMLDGLEIGEVAEQYLAEGSYVHALERFQSCLGILVPLLKKEPPGRRRDLLYKQVQLWMKEAESTKGLLATKDIEDSVQRGSYSFEQCIVQ